MNKIYRYNLLRQLFSVLFFIVFASAWASGQIITTYAGIGGVASYTGDGGPATDATMYSPFGLALDDSGNLYIAERINNIIRKVTPAGIISTFAGNGTSGYSGDGGPATNAKINTPYCIVTDHSGNLYFTDNGNNVIRKVNNAGIITTLHFNVLTGICPSVYDPIQNLTGIAIDDSGHIYFANTDVRIVMKIGSDNTAVNVAGNCALSYTGDGGPATHAALNHPLGIALDHAGNLYIGDDGNNVVRKVNHAGIISTYAGNGYAGGFYGDGGSATAAGLYGPFGVTTDSTGNLYIQDLFNRRIRKVNTSGVITTIAGNGIAAYTGDGGMATDASFYDCTGFAISHNGDFYISDLWYSVIRKVTMLISLNTDEHNINNKTTVFPNPNKGVFTLRTTANINEPIPIEITNILGQVVYKQDIVTAWGVSDKEIELNNQPNGIYLLHITGTNENDVITFVINK